MTDYDSDSIDGREQPRMVAVPAEWLERMEAQLKQAREALEYVEWQVRPGGAEFCPWCNGMYPDHKDDCQRQAALAAMDS